MSVNSPHAGTITELLFNEEDTVAVGQDLFRIEAGEVSESKSSEKPKEEPKKEETPKEQPKKEETPKEQPKEDKPLRDEPKSEAPPSSQPKSEKPAPKPETPKKESKPAPKPAAAPAAGGRGETRIKMNRMRVTIANRLKQSQNTAASLTTFNEIDMSALMSFRKKYKDEVLKAHEVKLGFMSAFAKASTLALKEIPSANAYIEVMN